MKNSILLFSHILWFAAAIGQQALHNYGGLKIHEDGAIGFHGSLINDGDFDTNEGLAGFYNETEELFIQGSNKPVFFDMEVQTPQDLNLEVSVGVTNFFNFINGRITTPRENLGVSLEFLGEAFYAGDDDDNQVDGYITTKENMEFTFPMGDVFRLRPLTVVPEGVEATPYQAAYFFENPNSPSTLPGSFNTDSYENTLSIIDNKEYWDLNGILPVQVKLTWDENTDVTTLADDSSSLRVVGFSTVLDKWVDLGNAEVTGDASNGIITSGVFVPDDFSALTLGSVLKGNGDIVVYTGVTPNGDGLNDTFIVEGLEASPDNELYLYNRWGVQVFYMKNYDNSFDGTSEGRTNYNAAKKLPAGTYYYLLNLKDREDRSGFFYITR